MVGPSLSEDTQMEFRALSRSVLWRALGLMVAVLILYPRCGVAAPVAVPTFVQYAGTFSDVQFTNGSRVVKSRRLELLVTVRTGAARRSPVQARSLIRITDATTGKVLQELPVVNSYASSDVEFYLGVVPSMSCSLLLQHESFVHLLPAEHQDQKIQARLLLSDRTYFIQVDGTYHFQPFYSNQRR